AVAVVFPLADVPAHVEDLLVAADALGHRSDRDDRRGTCAARRVARARVAFLCVERVAVRKGPRAGARACRVPLAHALVVRGAELVDRGAVARAAEALAGPGANHPRVAPIDTAGGSVVVGSHRAAVARLEGARR